MAAARLTAITLGVADVPTSTRFYEALGFVRKFRQTGDEVAFFETGASVLALYAWTKLAAEAGVAEQPRPSAFRGMTLAWNCASRPEVDAAFAHALDVGGTQIAPPTSTPYGGYAGYFADPDGHVWEVVVAPRLDVTADGRLSLPD